MLNRVFAALAGALMHTARVQLPPSFTIGKRKTKQRPLHKQAHKKMGKRTPLYWGPNHRGEKERDRAQRCYMTSAFNAPNGIVEPWQRSAPVMCQISKKRHAALVAQAIERETPLKMATRSLAEAQEA